MHCWEITLFHGILLREVELREGGATIPVTPNNLSEYLLLSKEFKIHEFELQVISPFSPPHVSVALSLFSPPPSDVGTGCPLQ